VTSNTDPGNDAPSNQEASAWASRLEHPLLGNVLAFAALVIALAAGFGILRAGLFWLIAGYATLVAALLTAGWLAWVRGRKLRGAAAENLRLSRELHELAADSTHYKQLLAAGKRESPLTPEASATDADESRALSGTALVASPPPSVG
jgi:hypothetical protein